MPGSEKIQTRSQRMAQAAFQSIEEAAKQPWKEKYGRFCVRLPALIQQCGLCQALTFLRAKATDEHAKPLQQLLDDLAGASGWAENGEALLQQVRTVDMTTYQRMTMELLRCAEWFERYAEAYLKIQRGADEGR